MKNISSTLRLILILCIPAVYSKSFVALDVDLKEYIAEVSPYIKQYPPHFKSKKQQKKITKKTKKIIRKLNKLDLSKENSGDFLIDAAQIYAMAHNLDLGTGSKARETFVLALKLQPDNSKANYLYGMFLISTNLYQLESEKYLQKAYSLGIEDALFSLGILELGKGNKKKGISLLEEYLKKNPDNSYTKKLIDAAKTNKIKFNKSK